MHVKDSVCDERCNDAGKEVCEPEKCEADWHVLAGVVVRDVQDAVLVLVSLFTDTLANSTYWNESAHEETNEEAAGEKACAALHEELTSSTYGPDDDLYGDPTVGSQLLA
jgi:hypothetical protein